MFQLHKVLFTNLVDSSFCRLTNSSDRVTVVTVADVFETETAGPVRHLNTDKGRVLDLDTHITEYVVSPCLQRIRKYLIGMVVETRLF